MSHCAPKLFLPFLKAKRAGRPDELRCVVAGPEGELCPCPALGLLSDCRGGGGGGCAWSVPGTPCPHAVTTAAAPGSRPGARCPAASPEQVRPHCLSCTATRLSLPSSWVTGWHPCKVSCTGAAGLCRAKSSMKITSTGSCPCASGRRRAWRARCEVTPSRLSLGGDALSKPLPLSQGVSADSLGVSCPLVATLRVPGSFQSESRWIQELYPTGPRPQHPQAWFPCGERQARSEGQSGLDLTSGAKGSSLRRSALEVTEPWTQEARLPPHWLQ